ncbi:MAG: glycerol-3-phosphate dehydrogenase [Kiritimatiellia bacterium]|jgi:glycerol-3-phosphate dehydrogenase
MPTREEMWERLTGEFDVLIVGGGINGAGIARDAARRGLRVALIEMQDLAFGTSSRSSKLVHGGLRYLEQLEFSLVFEAVSERRILLDIAPHLVNPLGFLLPIFDGSRTSLTKMRAGMWLYDGLSLFRSPKRHRTLGAAEVAEVEPTLRSEGLHGAPLYYDCSTDDARLTLESGLDAANLGAVIGTWVKCVDFVIDERGKISGATVECQLTGERRALRAAAVINATGPWTDKVVAMHKALSKPLLRPTKGVHIVVKKERLPVNHAVVCFHPEDGRVLFAIPWGDRTYVGTTDTDFEGDPADVCADASDVQYLLDASNAYFPGQDLVADDVIATWAGLRPLMAPVSQSGTEVDESSVSREHQIVLGKNGLITIAGGKLTTFRKMSEEVVDTAVRMLRLTGRVQAPLSPGNTDREPLPGAVGWPADDNHERVAASVKDVAGDELSEATCRLLTDTYGMRAMEIARRVRANPELGQPLIQGRPEVVAQVVWAVEEELACTINDVLVRRTQIFYRDEDQGLSAVSTVSEIMAQALSWSDSTRRQREQAYRDRVAQSRRWRDG